MITLACLQQELYQVNLARISLPDVSFLLVIFHPLTPTLILGHKSPLVHAAFRMELSSTQMFLTKEKILRCPELHYSRQENGKKKQEGLIKLTSVNLD